MKKILHWVVQENLFKENEWDDLIATFERFNIPYSVHKVIPFIGQLEPPFHSQCPIDDYKNVICMGSYSMRHVARENGWIPGVYDIFDQDFTVQMKHWGHLMLNADSIVVKFKDTPLLTEDTFIRPVDDSKYFAGRVFLPEEFNEWKHKVVDLGHDYGNSLSGETIIQLSKPKKIYAEYRFWIVDQQIVSASLYKRGDKVIYSDQVDQRIHKFVVDVLRTENGKLNVNLTVENTGWRPHDAYVLDVCETDDGMKIVEINTINAAGFYAGNIQDIVLSIQQMEEMRK